MTGRASMPPIFHAHTYYISMNEKTPSLARRWSCHLLVRRNYSPLKNAFDGIVRESFMEQ